MRIEAEANRDVASAWLDYECDGTNDIPSQAGESLRAVEFKEFTLALGEGGVAVPASYQLRFVDDEGVENTQPIRHQVEVVPDQPPTVSITAPGSSEIEVAVNGTEAFVFVAEDPDFALQDVSVWAERAGEQLLREPTLDRVYGGKYRGSYLLEPASLGVQAGELIELWVEARDNRRPEANRTETVRYRVRVVEQVSQQEAQRQREEAEATAEEREQKSSEKNVGANAGRRRR